MNDSLAGDEVEINPKFVELNSFFSLEVSMEEDLC